MQAHSHSVLLLIMWVCAVLPKMDVRAGCSKSPTCGKHQRSFSHIHQREVCNITFIQSRIGNLQATKLQGHSSPFLLLIFNPLVCLLDQIYSRPLLYHPAHLDGVICTNVCRVIWWNNKTKGRSKQSHLLPPCCYTHALQKSAPGAIALKATTNYITSDAIVSPGQCIC